MAKKQSENKDRYDELSEGTQQAVTDYVELIDAIHTDPEVAAARDRVAVLKAELAGAEFALEKSLDGYRRSMVDARKALEDAVHRDGAGWTAKGISSEAVMGFYRTTYDANALNALAESGNRQFEFLSKHRRQTWIGPRYAFVDQRDPTSVGNLPFWKE